MSSPSQSKEGILPEMCDNCDGYGFRAYHADPCAMADPSRKCVVCFGTGVLPSPEQELREVK